MAKIPRRLYANRSPMIVANLGWFRYRLMAATAGMILQPSEITPPVAAGAGFDKRRPLVPNSCL